MNKLTPPLLVCDFDGVIFNSIHESLLTSVNTYIAMESRHTLPLTRPLDLDEVISFEEKQSAFFRLFSLLIPLGNEAKDYYVILRIMDLGIMDMDQDRFDAFKSSLLPEVLNEYSVRFFEKRRAMQENNTESWLRLIQPFQGIQESFSVLADRFSMAVASAKDRRSITMLLEAYGFKFFPADRILDKEAGRSKRDHLLKLSEQGFGFERMYFIDDKIQHLLSVRDLHVHPLLALWGFNTKREHTIALENKIPLLALDDLKLISP